MPISTIVGTRIKFLRSVSIGLRTNDSGVDPDLKQKIDPLPLMMDTHTSLRADQTVGHVGKTCLHLSAGELLAQDNSATRIQADQVEAVLADVDPKGGNVLKRSFGHGSDPRAGRASIKGAPVSTAGPSH
jgi:hypothetical protein